MKVTLYLVITLSLVLAFTLTACGGSQEPSAPGQKQFISTCSSCHGPTGKGVFGAGKDLTASEFVADKSDAELIEFIKTGRDLNDPLNTTGVIMPPKGGNPALSEEEMQDIVSYLRALQEQTEKEQVAQ